MSTCQILKAAALHSWCVMYKGLVGCLQVPDIMSLQSPQDLKLEEGVAAVVKFGLGNLFSFAGKV